MITDEEMLWVPGDLPSPRVRLILARTDFPFWETSEFLQYSGRHLKTIRKSKPECV